MAAALLSSSPIIEEYWHCSWKERQSASPATTTNLTGTGLCDYDTTGYRHVILAGHADSSIPSCVIKEH